MLKLVVIAVLTLFLQNALTEEEVREIDVAQCQGQDINLTEDHLLLILKCAAKVKVASPAELTPDKMNCFARCLAEHTGMIDPDGTIHKERIIVEVNKSVPESFKKDVQKHLTECLDKYGPNLKPEDETCKSYGPLTNCIHSAYLQICIDEQTMEATG